MLPILILSVVPLVWGIYIAFTDSRAGLGVQTHFIGLDNFRALLDDTLFINAFKIGLIWAVSVTAIQFVLALGLALLLSQDIRGRWLARSLVLVPWAMPPVVVGIMWKLIYQPQAGVLNETLRRLHLPGENLDWLSSFSWALPAVIIVGVWAGMPQTTVALLAGLQSIPDDLHEAAAVDGATTWRRFLTMTIPQLRPVIIAITALDFIWNFNSFGIVYVLTEGGPANKTELPMLFAYNQAFKYGEFGYASALGCRDGARDRERDDLLPLGPAAGGDVVIVSSHPKRGKAGQYVVLALYIVFLGFPLLWMLSVSFKGPRELVELHPSFWPSEPTFVNYRLALNDNELIRAAVNSLKIATFTALLTTLIGLPAAYVLARRRGFLSNIGLGWILVSQMFPLILIIIPLFLLLRDLHLTNTHIGLILVYAVWALPFVLWMLQATYAASRGTSKRLRRSTARRGSRSSSESSHR